MRVVVDGRETSEERGVFRQYFSGDLKKLALLPIRDDEFEYYDRVAWSVADIVNETTDLMGPGKETSRRIVFQGQPLDCITTIQLLLGRKEGNSMVVLQRSSDAARWESDLGFLARLALRYDCNVLFHLTGSSHYYL